MVWHRLHSVMHELLQLFLFEPFAWRGGDGLHEVNELAALVVAGADGGLEGVGGAAGLRAQEVAGLVGGDGEEPRAEAAGGVKLGGGLVDLKEGFLEDILSRGPVVEEADEEM